MKKLLLFSLILGLAAANFILATPVHAISVHDHPWCNWAFWEDDYCSPKRDEPSPAAATTPAPTFNQAPVWASGQTGFNVKTGNTLQFSVSAFDPNNDPITYNVAFLPIGASFDSPTKTFSWTPSSTQAGTYLVQFSAYDGKAYAFQSITINVTEETANTNHKPVWSYISDQNVSVGQTLQFTVSATDPDGDSIAYSALNLPNNASFDSSSRTFSWIPEQNQVGTHAVTFRADDGENNSDLGVTIHASIPNNKPYFTKASPPATAKVGQFYSYDFNAVDVDNDPLTYSLPTAPLGVTINPATGLLQWTPGVLQTGFNYAVAAVSDGKVQTVFGFYIFVEGESGTPVQNPNLPAHPKPITSEKLKISDIKIENVEGEIVVSWNTNLPSTARVIYDTVSEADRAGNFTYANATPEIKDLTTDHRVTLGKMETGTVYYLRIVSKTADQRAISSEVVFIQLENGQLNSLVGASLIHIFQKLLGNITFLWLVILGLSAVTFFFYRKHQKANSPL